MSTVDLTDVFKAPAAQTTREAVPYENYARTTGPTTFTPQDVPVILEGITEDVEYYNRQLEEAKRAALSVMGVEPIDFAAFLSGMGIDGHTQKSQGIPAEFVEAAAVVQPDHKMSVIIDINAARQVMGRKPIQFSGTVFRALTSLQSPNGAAYTTDNRPRTAPALRLKTEDGLHQDIFLVTYESATRNGDIHPRHKLIVPSTEAGYAQWVCQTVIWEYPQDGRFRIEADRNQGPVLDQAPNVNDFGEVIGLVLKTLREMGYPVEGTTNVVFNTEREHLAYRADARRTSRNNNQGYPRITAGVGAMAAGVRGTGRLDEFATMGGG